MSKVQFEWLPEYFFFREKRKYIVVPIKGSDKIRETENVVENYFSLTEMNGNKCCYSRVESNKIPVMKNKFLKVNDQIGLHLPDEDYANIIFNLIDQNRDHLSKWLVWVDDTKSPKDTLTFLQQAKEKNKSGEKLSLFMSYEGNIVGLMSIVKFSYGGRQAEIGYWVDQKYQGKGIVTRSCARLIDYLYNVKSVYRVIIKAAAGNEKSRAIPQRLGFVKEGVLRSLLFHKNEYHDVYLYGMLKPEWVKS